MSDEQTPNPSALRLKPRLRPADVQGPAAGTPAIPLPPNTIPSAATPDTAAVEPPAAPKIRFKPKLEPSPVETGAAQTTSSTQSLPGNIQDTIPAMVPPSPMANPVVAAPSPPLFATPPAPSSTPPLFIVDPPMGSPAASTLQAATGPAPSSATVPPPGGDLGKFKLKPKSPSTTPPPAPSGTGAPPPVAFAPPPSPVPHVGIPPTGAPPPVAKAPPPFPVIAPPNVVKPSPPVAPPSVAPGAASPEAKPTIQTTPPVELKVRKRTSPALLVLAALVVAGVGFFAWNQFKPQSSASAPAKKSEQAKTAAPAATTTPSDTLNKLAHAPANAINQAQDAIANRRAAGQARIDAAVNGEDLPDRSFGPAPAAPTKQANTAPKSVPSPTTTTNVSPNVTATTHVEAAPEATASFRSFVANAKVSGVFQGTPARAVINGKLTRVGEVVDSVLGVTFDGVDADKRNLIFKDKSGATVSRRF